MSRLYISGHPAKQIEPPTRTRICFHPLQPTSMFEWTLIVPPCNLYIKAPTKCSLNFLWASNSTFGMAQTTFILIALKRLTSPVPLPKSLQQPEVESYVLRQSFATTVCNVVVFCFFGVHSTYHSFCIAASRKQTSLDATSASCCTMAFTAAVARVVALRRGFCQHCN